MIRTALINSSKSRLEYVISSPALPTQMKEYKYQVSGHGTKSNSEHQILNDGFGVLYKPVQSFPKGENEIVFYRQLSENRTEAVTELRKFIPQYIGLFSCDDPLKDNLYIGIEDLLYRFKQPSVIDVKIGQKSYESDASASKRASEIGKYEWRESVGFLITGIKVNGPEPLFLDRYHGRVLDPEEVYTRGIKVFLGRDPVRARLLATQLLTQLQHLLDWFQCQRQMSFIASSVLMAYESAAISNGEVNGVCGVTEDVLVKLIDFTHVAEAVDHDHNCIYGLESLLRYLGRAQTDGDC